MPQSLLPNPRDLVHDLKQGIKYGSSTFIPLKDGMQRRQLALEYSSLAHDKQIDYVLFLKFRQIKVAMVFSYGEVELPLCIA